MPRVEAPCFTGMGDAAIDVICHVGETFLEEFGIPKGSSAPVSAAMAETLDQRLKDDGIHIDLAPGGCAANSACIFTALGGQAVFLGKVGEDPYGQMFTHSLGAAAVAHPLPCAAGRISDRIYTFITPDGERSFGSFKDAGHALGPDDITLAILRSGCFYADGYLANAAQGVAAIEKAFAMAREQAVLCVFNPCSPSLIDRDREAMDRLFNAADGIICNLDEARVFTGEADAARAVSRLADQKTFAVVTDSAQGAWAQTRRETIHVSAPVLPGPLVNTNGAGDAFSGGFLYGWLHERPLPTCLALASACAAEILIHEGARTDKDLKHLAGNLPERKAI